MLTKDELAAARADVPALLAHIEELEAKLQRARDAADGLADLACGAKNLGALGAYKRELEERGIERQWLEGEER